MQATRIYDHRRERQKSLYRQLKDDPELIVQIFNPFSNDIDGIVVESAFNWYWVRGLFADEGYETHLANPAKMERYLGLKHSDDEAEGALG